MKKLLLILALSVINWITAGALDDLQAARQNLVQGKQQIAQGRADVEKGYLTIKSTVIAPLSAGITSAVKSKQDTQDQETQIRDAYKKGATIFGEMAVSVYPVTVAAGVAGLATLAYVGDIPDVIHSAIPAIESIQNTLQSVADPIIAANEKMRPQVGGFIAAAQSAVATAQASLDANSKQFTPDFSAKVAQALKIMQGMISIAQGALDPITRTFKPDRLQETRDKLLRLAAGLDTNFGDTGGVGAADDIVNTLAPYDKQTWLAEINATKQLKLVYEKFNTAEKGFENAIAKIDTVINALKALQEAVSGD